jgi:hypothetical protein
MQYLMILQTFVLITSYLKEMLLNICMKHNIIAQNGMHGTWDRSTSTRCLFYICGSRDGNIVNEDVTYYEKKNWT